MDYFAKKQWIRIAVCAVLVGVIVLAMTGVFSGSKELIYDPAATNGDAAASAEATEQGFAGDVTAHVTLDGDKIQWTEPLDNRNLECVVQVLPLEEKERTKWISHKLIVDEPEEDWEW